MRSRAAAGELINSASRSECRSPREHSSSDELRRDVCAMHLILFYAMTSPVIHIRLMAEADLPFGMRLKAANGWNQTEADWRRYLELQPDGCFLAELDGKPVGTG